jgi:acetyl esterase/lipase
MLVVLAILHLLSGAPDVAPPTQPASGPGGAAYEHDSVTKTRFGEGAAETWIFEPDQPRPESAPVIVFLHGLSATNPRTYGAWIDHLVRQGNVVVYPRFQSGIIPRPRTFTRNTMRAYRGALALLEQEGHVQADPERIAVVGHSTGGILAANLAARAEAEDLPVPRAVFCVLPGSTDTSRLAHIALDDLSSIPEGTLMLTLAGDADSISGENDARRIYREALRVPATDKDLLILASDAHGEPDLRANHLFPLATDDRFAEDADYGSTAPNPVADALDYYGTWKLLDALCDAAFDGTNREYALGNTTEQRHMGKWSDGQPVQELLVLDPELQPKSHLRTD